MLWVSIPGYILYRQVQPLGNPAMHLNKQPFVSGSWLEECTVPKMADMHEAWTGGRSITP